MAQEERTRAAEASTRHEAERAAADMASRAEATALKSNVAALEAAKAALEANAKELAQRAGRAEDERARLAAEAKELQNARVALTMELGTLKGTLAAKESEVTRLEAAARSADDKNAQQLEKFEAARKEHDRRLSDAHAERTQARFSTRRFRRFPVPIPSHPFIHHPSNVLQVCAYDLVREALS